MGCQLCGMVLIFDEGKDWSSLYLMNHIQEANIHILNIKCVIFLLFIV